MILSATLAILLSVPAFACWAPCPEGKECYFEEVWLSQAELQKMADAQCPTISDNVLQASTGLTVKFQCSSEKNQAVQTAPNLAQRIKGEETPAQDFRSDCSGQEDCLAADKENRKLFDQMKAEKTASNTPPVSP